MTYLKCAFLSLVGAATCLANLPRAISLSPQVSDLMIEAGFRESLIGSVTRYAGPAHAMADLGSFLHPNAEKIFALDPDWVLTDEGVPLSPARSRWEAQRAKTLVLKLGQVTDLVTSVATLSQTLFGRPSPLTARIEACLAKVQGLPRSNRTALVFVSLTPPILAARGAFLHDLVVRAGYTPLTDSHWQNPYPLVTEEWLVARNPDVVFYLDYNFGERDAVPGKTQKWWPQFKGQTIALPQEPFARATLQTLRHWETLGLATPKECREVL